MSIKRITFVVLGCVSLALAVIGVVLPILPTVPFLALAAFCFAKSSDRLNNWLINTKFYQNNLADFKAGKGMTVKTKVRILATVTLVMAVGLIAMLMKGVIVGSIILSVVWLGHIYYFGFKVKTLEE
ncbi:MAG: YbaN family protein [Atopobium sp.]|uniref:YbaN family protein n=1 Tax=Lancefieldella parvula TaxID=1382 RepID=UPI00050E6A72|nr:YbaN family protein [Lancefieldella parvula]KGF12989.1 membrane protein [Lancefieldella parvula DNF00906]MBF0948340.1 YbaN family protein [Atopobium sp.]MDU5528659.1 YbaN family protein [Atopobium sp.]